MRIGIGFLAIITLGLCLAAQSSQSDSLLSEIDGITHDLEQITGLKFTHRVPSAVIDKDQLRNFLNHRIDKAMKPADLKAESLTLKMLGLVPQDFDLRQETLDLLTEQAAAFYDYKKKKLFLLNGDNSEGGLMALAHELAHALADQNFNLNNYIRENESDDAATARMAVMEGQATWLMSAYLHMRAGLGSDIPDTILKMMSNSVSDSASQYPVYSQSPLYIRESLTFPYQSGMLFQDTVYRKLGKAGFAEVFRRAPASTQQILHPERYLENTAPVLPPVPAIPDRSQFKPLAEGTLGEFDYRILLTQFGSEEDARVLAAAVKGSRFMLLEAKDGKYPVLAFASKWQTLEKARDFLNAYRSVLRGKSKMVEFQREDENALVGHDDAGFFRVVLNNDVVESIEGWKSSLN